MKNYTSLIDYSHLPLTEKLRVGLLPSTGMQIAKNFRDEKIVDVKKHDKDKLLKFVDGIPNYFLREEVYLKLIAAAKVFSENGITILIHEMYRSLKKQTMEFNQIKSHIHKKYPSLNKKEIWQKTTEFIADPKMLPPHCTGAAIDLELIDSKGPLAMGTPINAIDEKANILATGLTKQERQNRNLLMSIMMGQGFAPLSSEWWHFSYGDRNWAAFYNSQIIYNIIDLD